VTFRVRGILLSTLAGSTLLSPSVVFATDTVVSTTRTTTLNMVNDDTLTVQSGVTFNVSGNPAVSYRGGSNAPGVVVNNAGTISSSTTRAVDTSGSVAGSLTINNTGTISSTGNDGIRVNIPATNFTLDNSGMISSTVGRGMQLNAITSGNISITNRASGTIQSSVDDAMRVGQGAVVTNYGTLFSNGVFVGVDGSKSDGVDFDVFSGSVINKTGGTISGYRHGITSNLGVTVTNELGGSITGRNGSGVGSDGTGTVTNYGTITGAYAGNGTQNGDGDGVDIDLIGTVTNYGTIQGTGAGGVDSGGRPNGSEGIAMGGGTITNYAGGLISGANNGILVDDGAGGSGVGATTIYNEGTIRGLSGFAIGLVGNFNDTLTNKGVITGNVNMGAGDDTVNYYIGSSINGILNGEAGTDTLNLYGSGAQTLVGSNAINFEQLNVKTGSVWTLTGTHNYSSGVSIESGGTLIASGVVNAPVTVASGATLQGTGTVGSFVNNGLVTPGTSIGTMTVTGNATFNVGSTYQVKGNAAGSSDRINAATATINGGAVQVLAESGAYAASTNYTILSTTGGRTGQFQTVTSNFAFLTPSLSYSANDVTLTLARNATLFQQAAVGGNQQGVAGAIDQAPTNSALYQSVVGLSGTGAQQAFTALSGEPAAAATNSAVQSTGQVLTLLTGEFAQGGAGGNGPTATGYAEEQSPMAAYAAMVTKAKPAPETFAKRWTGWGSAYGGRSQVDANSSAGTAATTTTTGGIAAGFDIQMTPSTMLGFGVAAGRNDFSTGSLGNGRGDTVQLFGRAGTRFGEYYLTGAASAGWTDLDMTRYVNFPGVSATYSGKSTAFGLGGRLEAGRDMRIGAGVLTPFAALQGQWLRTPGYSEATVFGPATYALNFASQDNYRLRSELGAGLQHWILAGAAPVRLYGRAAWAHEFQRSQSAGAAFQSVPTVGFTVTAAGAAADAALLRAGLDILVRSNVTVGARIDAELAQNSTAYTGMGTVRVAW
jgi:subtilase-type serine protease